MLDELIQHPQAVLLSLAIIVGALAGPTTIFHTFAVAFDIALQSLGTNSPVGVTISSRAGLSARSGHVAWALIIGFAMLSWPPFSIWRNAGRKTWRAYLLQHCEDAILADIERAEYALAILQTHIK